ncbi:MAG: chemotaxis response regulator protein-glutamate methylesterase [Deferribacterales bacterium]|nr:chemotaxis response regulator protein-glutamate methylesterase [Deferribacterales bacterium]
MTKTKVLIVDDSVFMRRALESILKEEADIEIVGLARNGKEAVEMVEKFSPDVITMDIEMPVMDGLTSLEIIMKDFPTPVIMVSSLTKEGADATLKALDIGAVDFIPKDSSFNTSATNIEADLKAKIRKFAKNKSMMRLLTARRSSAAGQGVSRPTIKPNVQTRYAPAAAGKQTSASKVIVPRSGVKRVVALGTSTGGPQSLQKVIPLLPADFSVPIVITQHMPPNFTQSLAARLNALSKLTVVEAQGKEKLEPGVVYIAKGGLHLVFKKVGANVYTDLSPEPSNCFNIPSVDVMVDSITDIYRSECLGVIMTGMGADGSKGLAKLKQAGGTIISQDEASCIVYGMPRAVIEAGIADEIVPLEEIASRIVYHCK